MDLLPISVAQQEQALDEIVIEPVVDDGDAWQISDINETNHGDSHVTSTDEGENTSNKKNDGSKSGVISRDEGEKTGPIKTNRKKSGNIVLRRSERIKKLEAEKKLKESMENTVPVQTKKGRKKGIKKNKNSDKTGKKTSKTSGSKTSRKFGRETLESESHSPQRPRVTITKQYGKRSKINLEVNVENVNQTIWASMFEEIENYCRNKLQNLNGINAQTTVDDVALNMPDIDIKEQRRNLRDFISRQKSCLQEEIFLKENGLLDKILDVKMNL